MEVRFAKKFFDGEPDEFDDHCRATFGKQMAKLIARRLSHARVAKSLADLMAQGFPGRWHWLTGDRRLQISADLDHPRRLLFEPGHPYTDFTEENGSLNAKGITILIVVEVADTH